jgi:cephalosporin-C deacetylase-like acetyl esterase
LKNLKYRGVEMPMLDMSIEKLKEYKGINHYPESFDEYWTRALKEIDTVQFARMDMEDVDADRVGVTGCSQGGA